MKLLSLLFFTAVALFLSAFGLCFSAHKRAARAEAPKAELFLPSSYEQYLPLENPSDSAMTERYIAIADGSRLYLYDRVQGAYSCIRHTNLYGNESGITKVQFTFDGRLYYSDEDTFLYRYEFSTGEAVLQNNIPCSTFLIEGNIFYTVAFAGTGTTTASVYAYSCAEETLSNPVSVGTFTSNSAPCLSAYNGRLYCAQDDIVYIYTPNGEGYRQERSFLAESSTTITRLSSLYVFEGEIYYTVNGSRSDDGLYRAELEAPSTLLLKQSGFNSLFSYKHALYCVQGRAVREIAIDGDNASFTGYEITGASNLFNRESEAEETVRGGDLLLSADNGNHRLFLYHMKDKLYSSIPLESEAYYLATDGNIIAVSGKTTISLYRYGESEPFDEKTILNGTEIKGLACVFGTCYYVTDHSYGVVGESMKEITRASSPAALASDVWGNLYVADNRRTVTKYSEKSFLIAEEGEPLLFEMPENYSSFRSDFDGNLYYLTENALWCNGKFFYENTTPLVYGGENTVRSFALGYEDATVYLQYGNFMGKASLPFPTLSTIATEGIAERVFTTPEAPVFTEIHEGATSVAVDIAALTPESDYFSYLSYARSHGGRGILLAETGAYSLVALYEHYGYHVSLYHTEDCTAVTVTVTEENGIRYTANSAPLSFYPCIFEALIQTALPRATRVALLATVTQEGAKGFDFAYVQTAEGMYGYVPLAYLTEIFPLAVHSESYRLAYLKESTEGTVFRSANGEQVTLTERTLLRIYDGEDGLYIAEYEENGTLYSAQVTSSSFEKVNNGALRVSLIIILCVLAVGILIAYIVLVPHKKKNRN